MNIMLSLFLCELFDNKGLLHETPLEWWYWLKAGL